jgi:hypothetical protein
LLGRAEEFLAHQTPESYMKMVAVASESLRRARDPGKGLRDPGEEKSLLDEFRAMMEPDEVVNG